MRKVFTALLLLLSLSAFQSYAQAQPADGRARRIDQFGEIQWSDLMARLDNFAIELQNEPAARGLVVAYPAPHKFPGWPVRRAHAAVVYLTSTRGLDAARLSAVNGGLSAETLFELWLVPPGAESPVKPYDVMFSMAGEKRPLAFDRFAVAEPDDDSVSAYGLEPSPDSAEVYEFFAEVLRRDPSLRGCVIGYAPRRGSLTSARRIAERAKLTIAKAHAIDVTRVVAVGGGRRDYKMIELWLVPPGAALPRPTPARRPATRPKQQRRRSR